LSADLSKEEKHPLIIPHSHHVATLLDTFMNKYHTKDDTLQKELSDQLDI